MNNQDVLSGRGESGEPFCTLADEERADADRKPLVRATADGVLLMVYPYSGGCNGYPIAWHRLNSRARLLRWIRHLSGKRWFSGDLCRELIDRTAARFGWDAGGEL